MLVVKTKKKESKLINAEAMIQVRTITIRNTVGQRSWNKGKIMLDYVKVTFNDTNETFEFGISLIKLQYLINAKFLVSQDLVEAFGKYLSLPQLKDFVE